MSQKIFIRNCTTLNFCLFGFTGGRCRGESGFLRLTTFVLEEAEPTEDILFFAKKQLVIVTNG